MTVRIRLPRGLYQLAMMELRRRHQFAWERVGFFFGRVGNGAGDERIVLLSAFEPVADEHYVDDEDVGARIGPFAIQAALQRVMTQTLGAFHVHIHDYPGVPRFSPTDLRDADEVVRPFRTVVPSQPHGFLLFSADGGAARVWLPGEEQGQSANGISVVGAPMSLWGGSQ